MQSSRILYTSLPFVLAACASRPIEERMPRHITKDLVMRLWERVPEEERPAIIRTILHEEVKRYVYKKFLRECYGPYPIPSRSR